MDICVKMYGLRSYFINWIMLAPRAQYIHFDDLYARLHHFSEILRNFLIKKHERVYSPPNFMFMKNSIVSHIKTYKSMTLYVH